jgi:hypothetical protein
MSKKSKSGLSFKASDSSSKTKVRGSGSSGSYGKARSRTQSSLEASQTREVRKNFIVDYCKRRKEFLDYVMSCSIKPAVVRAIVSLYEEPTKPDNALGYIRCFLGATLPSEDHVRGKLEKIEEMRNRIAALDVENQGLRERLEELELKEKTRIDSLGVNTENAGEYDGDLEDEGEVDTKSSALADDLAACVDSDLNFTFFNL